MDAHELREEFERQAEWRRDKAAEDLDDKRNTEAAEIFDRLAQSAANVDPAVIDTFVSLYESLEDGEIWQEWLRQVGFHRWPATAEDLVREFIADRAVGK